MSIAYDELEHLPLQDLLVYARIGREVVEAAKAVRVGTLRRACFPLRLPRETGVIPDYHQVMSPEWLRQSTFTVEVS